MSRSGRLKFTLAIAVVAMMATLVAAYAQMMPDPSGYPSPYHLVQGWGPAPAGRKWGNMSTINADRQGHVWLGDRCGGNTCAGTTLDPVLEFDSDGKLMKGMGAGIVLVVHDVYPDKDGNVWVVDAGNKDGVGEQVLKFSPDGKVLMRLGTAGVTGSGPDTFNYPDGVVVAPNGDIFVADGHSVGTGNARIMKFSKDGKFIMQWGEHGSGPGQFEVPHAIAMDSKGRIFVGERGNMRIQIFDQNGKFLDQWKQFGSPSGLFIDQNDVLYAADTQSTDQKGANYNPGFQQGIRIGSAKDGKVTAFIPIPPKADGGTNAPEGVAADPKGNVYASDGAQTQMLKFAKD